MNRIWNPCRGPSERHRPKQHQNVVNTRAQVLVEVQQAYYRALASESALKVAQATLDLRRVTLRQVSVYE